MPLFAGHGVLLAVVAAAALAIPGAWLVLRMRRRRVSARICRRWGLDPDRVRVVASDLGRHRATWSLRADGLVGNPDVLFRDRGNGRLIVGEAKSRHHRGSVTPYERYQVTLYLGMVERLYRRPATAVLLYGNGRLVRLDFDEGLYRRLVALIPRCRQDTPDI